MRNYHNSYAQHLKNIGRKGANYFPYLVIYFGENGAQIEISQRSSRMDGICVHSIRMPTGFGFVVGSQIISLQARLAFGLIERAGRVESTITFGLRQCRWRRTSLIVLAVHVRIQTIFLSMIIFIGERLLAFRIYFLIIRKVTLN